MKKYPREHWQALGDLVSTARHQAGYSDTKRWAEAVGRSSRMLLGLERGEPVGPKTIEAIAETLGIANWSLFEVLDRGRANEWGASTEAEIAEARKRYQDETGLEADEDGGDPLRLVPDEDLLTELARRLATRPLSRTERRMIEARANWPEPSEAEVAAHIAVQDDAEAIATRLLSEVQGDAAAAVESLERLYVLDEVEVDVFAVALKQLVARRDAERDEESRRRSLSVAPDEVRDAVAADEQESSIAGEQEESDTP